MKKQNIIEYDILNSDRILQGRFPGVEEIGNKFSNEIEDIDFISVDYAKTREIFKIDNNLIKEKYLFGDDDFYVLRPQSLHREPLLDALSKSINFLHKDIRYAEKIKYDIDMYNIDTYSIVLSFNIKDSYIYLLFPQRFAFKYKEYISNSTGTENFEFTAALVRNVKNTWANLEFICSKKAFLSDIMNLKKDMTLEFNTKTDVYINGLLKAKCDYLHNNLYIRKMF